MLLNFAGTFDSVSTLAHELGHAYHNATMAERTPLQRQGALVFKAKQCHDCHALGETGGQRGPALDRVAVRLAHRLAS